ELRLTLAVASEIAPAIRDTASEWAASARAPDNQCVAVDVRPIEPADVAVAITGAAGVTLPGLSSESGSTLVPDVWVPDATSWLHRVRAVGQSLVPDEAESIARSPIVIAMPEPVASTLGWPSERLSWTALLEQVRNNQSMNLGIVEPSRDAAGLSGLMALGAAAGAAGRDADATTVAIMRTLIRGRTVASEDLLARFPQKADPQAIAAGLTAAPVAERAVIEY